MISWDVAQFTWERYTGKLTELEDMNREEVVAMLKRHSTGFSRCPSHAQLAYPLCQKRHSPEGCMATCQEAGQSVFSSAVTAKTFMASPQHVQ